MKNMQQAHCVSQALNIGNFWKEETMAKNLILVNTNKIKRLTKPNKPAADENNSTI